MGDPPLLPRYSLPPALEIPRVTLDQPKALIPSYRPLVVPPSDLRAPPGVEASGEAEKNTEKKEGSLRHGTGAYIPDFANLTMLCPMLFGRGCIR